MEDEQQRLRVRDFLGVFYREDGRLMVADEFEGARDVEEEMSSFVGPQVRLVVHHRPVEPIDHSRWGGGCCFLEASGFCSFGHHQNPESLYTFSSRGVLRVEGDKWVLNRGPDKDEIEVPTEFLVGHRSQVLVSTVLDEEAIKSKMKDFESRIEDFESQDHQSKKIDDLSAQLTEMRDFLNEINQLKNDLDV